METNKFKALESQEISKNELDLVPMPLPLVYRCGHTFIVRNGLDLKRRKELWGIEILPGTINSVIMSLRRGTVETPEGFVPATWYNVLNKIKKSNCGGRMPSAGLLKERWGIKEEALLEGTLKRLNEWDIDAGKFMGVCWCYGDDRDNESGVFSFAGSHYDRVSCLAEDYLASTRMVIAGLSF